MIMNAAPALANMPKKILRLYTPHAGQIPIHKSKARFRIVCCGRRFGKTLMCCNLISEYAVTHKNAVCAWVAPTYRQSKIAYRLIKKALAPVITKSLDNELRIELISGSFIMFCSADNYDALRGNGIHFLVMDESADINERAWTEVLRPTLSDTQGKALLIGTPKGKNFFYRLFCRGNDPEYTDWQSFTAPTSANPYITAAEIEAAKRELPEATYEQEYDAVFLDNAAGVFRGLDAIVKPDLELLDEPEAGHDYVIGWDPAKYLDYSVCTIYDASSRRVVHWTRSNSADYNIQLAEVVYLAQRFGARVLMDMTGVGDPLLERLKLSGIQADGFLFTNSSKKALIENLQIGIQNRAFEMPEIPVVISEMRMFQYEITPSRFVTYSAPPGEHDDTVISLALAYMAGSQPRGPLVWSAEDDSQSQRTKEQTEAPEAREYNMVVIERGDWQEQGEWYEMEVA